MEWYRSGHNEHDWKSCDGQKPSEGSNPSHSATSCPTTCFRCEFSDIFVGYLVVLRVKSERPPSQGRDQGLDAHQVDRSCQVAGKEAQLQLRCGFRLSFAQQVVCASVLLHRSKRVLRQAHSLLQLFFVVLYPQNDLLFRHMPRVQRVVARTDPRIVRDLLCGSGQNAEHFYRHAVCLRPEAHFLMFCVGACFEYM